MAKPKIIVRPKRIVTRKQRKAIVDTSYLLDENKKIHKTTDSQLVIASNVLPTTPKQKKTKKEYVGRKKDRKKSREKKKAKRIQEQRNYARKEKKRKVPKPTSTGIESKPTPIGIESKSVEDDYIPTVDIFDIIEQYIMSIPSYIETWRKGTKGYLIHDMQPFKMSLISMVRDFSMSDDKEVEEYFKNNEYAIKECIDSFKAISTEEELYTLEGRLVNLINMGHALSADTMNYLELLEY
mgnify:CR=1 FL=1|jgi:hypothetical protein